MVNLLTKLVLGAGLLSLGLVGFDLSKEKGEALETITIFGTESLAFGCGANYLNHQEGFTNGTVCYGSSGQPTDYSVLPYEDCRDMLNSCCAMPSDAPLCPTLGG